MRRLAFTVVLAIVVLAGFAASAFANPSAPRPVTKPHVTRAHERHGRLGVSSTVGGVLTASAGTWTNTPTGYTYEWQDCNANASTCTNIPGATTTTPATSNTYTIQQSDVGSYVRVGVQATNATGQSSFEFSTVTAQITSSASAPTNTSAPAVSGTAMQTDALSATTGTWTGSPTGYAYQWQRCTSTNTSSCANISGATSNSYTLAVGDVNDFIRVGVSATNAAGTTGPAFSTMTSQVITDLPVNTLVPSLAGTAVEGDVVTLTPGTFSNETSQDGTWEDCPTATSTSCSSIVNTGNTYTLAAGDVGAYVRLMEVATNANGTTTVWSNAIGPVTSSGGGGGTSGYTGTCNKTISASPTSNAVGTAESTMTAGQVLCLNSGTYGNTTTAHNNFTASGSAGSPIIVTSGPGQTATIEGWEQVSGSWITLEYMNIDESNNQISEPASQSGTANPIPPCVASAPKAQAIQFESGTHDTLQFNNIYESVAATRQINIYITASNTTIQNNQISNGGSCSQTQHLIYLSAGSGSVITQNWFWGDSFGYAIQIYPSPASATISSNVFDGTLEGIVDDTNGSSGNTTTHNVAINSINGDFLDCYAGLDDGGSHPGDTITNNAYVSPVVLGCSSESGITFSGNISLSADPFVSSSTHNYNLGTNSSATAISGYGLWNGVGPPTPNPALSLTSVPLRPSASPESTVPWWIVAGGIAVLVAAFGGFAVWDRRRSV